MYRISQLISEHNHALIEPSQRHLLRSARKIQDTSKGVIKSMANVGIRATQTYAYLLNEAGGYPKLAWCGCGGFHSEKHQNSGEERAK